MTAAALVFIVCTPGPLRAAYIDPGTGSLLLQGLIGLVAGSWLLMRTFLKGRILTLFRRRSGRVEPGTAEQGPS